MRFFGRTEPGRLRTTIETLRMVPGLQDLSRSDLRLVAGAVHERSFARDEYLYCEADPGLGLYIIQKGRVRLTLEDPDGNPMEVRQVGPYAVIGSLALFGEFPRLETAKALTEVEGLGFYRPDMNALLKRNPKTGAQILHILARLQAATLYQLVELVTVRESRIQAIRLLHQARERVGEAEMRGSSEPVDEHAHRD